MVPSSGVSTQIFMAVGAPAAVSNKTTCLVSPPVSRAKRSTARHVELSHAASCTHCRGRQRVEQSTPSTTMNRRERGEGRGWTDEGGERGGGWVGEGSSEEKVEREDGMPVRPRSHAPGRRRRPYMGCAPNGRGATHERRPVATGRAPSPRTRAHVSPSACSSSRHRARPPNRSGRRGRPAEAPDTQHPPTAGGGARLEMSRKGRVLSLPPPRPPPPPSGR